MQEKSNKLTSGLRRKSYACPSLIKHQKYSTSIHIQNISVPSNSVNITFDIENYFDDFWN